MQRREPSAAVSNLGVWTAGRGLPSALVGTWIKIGFSTSAEFDMRMFPISNGKD